MLVVDGAETAGDLGTYPVHNPVRPAEVVLEAPSASLAQVDVAVRAASVPFGGWKQSGFGREYGVDGIVAYTRSRARLTGPALPGAAPGAASGEGGS